MQEHHYYVDIDATVDELWQLFWARIPHTRNGDVTIDILYPGDEIGEGLIRHCTFRVPRYLLTGGKGQSWEWLTEVTPKDSWKYTAVGRPLLSEAEGRTRLEDLGDGRTRVHFSETYHAFNPLLRALLEKRVHAFISKDNDRLIKESLTTGVRLPAARQKRRRRASRRPDGRRMAARMAGDGRRTGTGTVSGWISAPSGCGGAARGGSRRRGRCDAAAELESLGYGTLWSSGRFEPGPLRRTSRRLLASTSRIAVASGIVSIWAGRPKTSDRRWPSSTNGSQDASCSASERSHSVDRGRLRPSVLPHGRLPRRARMRSNPTVPPDRRVLAALGPRMLELAATRSAGAHPYFVPVEHTARARAIIGDGPLLAPEVAVVLDERPAGPAPRPAGTPPRICSCPTIRRTCAPSVSATRNSTGTGATA